MKIMKLNVVVFWIVILLLLGTSVNAMIVEDNNIKIIKENNNIENVEEPFDGYILYSPEFSRNTYLINNKGEVVHKWDSIHIQVLPVHLIENGNLIRGCAPTRWPTFRFLNRGFTGLIEMFNWDGELVWEFEYSDNEKCLHNDIEPLPNGNILMTVWGYRTRDEAIAAGIDPSFLTTWGGLKLDHIIEVEPTYPKGGNIVWEWYVWDHLIQDFDPTKDNYGLVADHPELININAKVGRKKPLLPFMSVDFTHMNSIAYSQELDQIIISIHSFNEIWVIDHNTTTEESAGHTGGHCGKGGDILYRWGNPQNYHAGDEDDQKLFLQHDPQWIKPGHPGEGNILIFNNGWGRPDGNYTSIEEIVPPIDENGNYYLEPGSAYGPEEPVWRYIADPPSSFFAPALSGIQRLPNGNTLICDGKNSYFFVVTPDYEVIWRYDTPRSKLLISKIITNLDDVFKIRYYPADYLGIQNLSIP